MTRKQRAEHQMVEALSYLKKQKIYYSRPVPFHIKIGPSINYWPASGKAFVDGDKKCHPERGLRALEAVLRSQGYLSAPSPYTNPRRSDDDIKEIGITLDPDEQ